MAGPRDKEGLGVSPQVFRSRLQKISLRRKILQRQNPSNGNKQSDFLQKRQIVYIAAGVINIVTAIGNEKADDGKSLKHMQARLEYKHSDVKHAYEGQHACDRNDFVVIRRHG